MKSLVTLFFTILLAVIPKILMGCSDCFFNPRLIDVPPGHRLVHRFSKITPSEVFDILLYEKIPFFRSGTSVPGSCLYPLRDDDDGQGQKGYDYEREQQGYHYVKDLSRFMDTLDPTLEILAQRRHLMEYLTNNPALRNFFERAESAPFITDNLFRNLVCEDDVFRREEDFISFKDRLKDQKEKLEAFLPKDFSLEEKAKIVLKLLPEYAKESGERLGKMYTLMSNVRSITLNIIDQDCPAIVTPISEKSTMTNLDFLMFFYQGYDQEIKFIQSSLGVYATGGYPDEVTRETFDIRPPFVAIYQQRKTKHNFRLSKEHHLVERDENRVLDYLYNTYFLYTTIRLHIKDLYFKIEHNHFTNSSTKNFLQSEMKRLEQHLNYIWRYLPTPKVPFQHVNCPVKALQYHLERTKSEDDRLLESFEEMLVSQREEESEKRTSSMV